MGEIKFITALVLISLFAIAIVTYVTNFGIDNDAAVQLGDDDTLSSLNQNINTQVEDFRIDANDSYGAFQESEITSDQETTRTGGQFKVGLGGLLTSIKLVLNTIRDKIFGGSTALAIFLTAFISMLFYMGFRYIWKTWKGGNPD